MKIATIILLSLMAFGLARSAACPIHDRRSSWTGKVDVVGGTLAYEYRCPRGHKFWAK